MKNFIKIFLTGFLLLVVLFLAVGSMLSKKYEVSRSIVVNAPKEKVHNYVGDLRMWDEWSPWKNGDANLKITFGEKTSGVGASQKWVSENGDGSLKFTSSDPEKGIEYDLSFDEGNYICKSSMLYETVNGGTKITWNLTGDATEVVLGGYFALLMDYMAGPMFENGLSKLKSKVE